MPFQKKVAISQDAPAAPVVDAPEVTFPQQAAQPSPPLPPVPKPVQLIPIKLKRGYWPQPGAIYFDADGNQCEVPGDTVREVRTAKGELIDTYVDEAVRKSGKLLPGTRMLLPPKQAKPLIDTGKADLDVSVE